MVQQAALDYDSRPLSFTAAVVEQEVNTPHRVVALRVPSALVASVKFFSKANGAIPLQAGWNRFCFETSPERIFLTVDAAATVDLLTAERIVPDFFSLAGASQAGLGEHLSHVWPDPGLQFTSGVTALNGTVRFRGGATAGLFDAGFGVGGAAVMTLRNEILGARWLQRANTYNFGAMIQPNQVAGMGSDYALNPPHRVYVWGFFMSAILNGAAWHAIDDGVKIQPAFAASPGAPSGGTPFFGLSPNVAGTAIHWQSKNNFVIGPATEDIAITWPGAITVPAWVEFWLYSANGARHGFVEVYVNGTRVILRSWDGGVASVLPSHSASTTRFVGRIASTVAGNSLFCGLFHSRFQDVDRDRVAV